MLNLRRVRRADPVRAEDFNALIDAVAALADGPKVSAPLAALDGTIYLDDDYEFWDAITTGAVSARSGNQMGSGYADLQIPSVDGVLRDAPGYRRIKVWNNTGGPIPSGRRCYVRRVKGLWRVVEADCSLVP